MERPFPEAQASDETDWETLGAVRVHRPVHLHPGFVLVVIVGGTFGALARYGLGSILPAPGGWPLPTLVINLAGAFMLGALLEALVRRGPDAGRLRVVRLLVGTGFMGAFTTYSTLAVEATTLFSAGRGADAFIYVGASVVAGAVATVAGIRLAAAHHARTTSRPGKAGSPTEGNR
ncbi:CrcB family protein [Arthrobacter sp. ISL-85]|uniref:fluoride efflux transporter FluC n=1 Tax=Arthrobacter sp. ISL-85 TaxID=2819115 RepID=UPI001BEA262A|nr:CrcB family protein [Arthrobacter sp. ISL-85]MBT2565322.1 CrcB family protein [Arthrobacter sp. ISL-85]